MFIRKYFFVILVFFIYGCPQKVDVIPESKLIYLNETPAKIKGYYYYNNHSSVHFTINAHSEFVRKFEGKLNLQDYLYQYDSMVVFYDDTIRITHYKDTMQGGARHSILVPENWEIVEETENYREYRFTFTEEDYREVLKW